MLLRVMSDLHIEFIPMSKWEDELEVLVPYLPNEHDMVLVLAGDIAAAGIRESITPWIKDLSQRHRAVVMVTGNHEGYHGSHEIATTYWKYVASMNKNLYVLENNTVFLDTVRFLGTTLWTCLDAPMDEFYAKQMNDFDLISGWTIAQWKYTHNIAIEFLKMALSKDFVGKTVIVTHHLPTFSSIDAAYLNDKHNCSYASNLDNLITYNDIDVWCHGHTHGSFDYMAGDTRIVCNPHGYFPNRKGDSDGRNFNFNPTLTVEV